MSMKLPRITVGIEDREGVVKRFEAILVQSIPTCVLTELESKDNREIIGVLRTGQSLTTSVSEMKQERELRKTILEELLEAQILRFSTRPFTNELERIIMGPFYEKPTDKELKCPYQPKT